MLLHIIGVLLVAAAVLAQEQEEVGIKDVPMASLSIRVVAKETREPIPEAKVQVFGGQVGTTDPDGIALMDNLPTGRCRVVVSKEDFATAYQYVNLEPDKEASLEVALGPEGKIIGIVTNEYGEILRDATCSIYTKEGRLDREPLDENGIFTIDGLSIAESYTLQIYQAEYCTKTLTDVKIPEETRLLTLEIALDTGGYVKGKVTDMRGRPVEGAHVTASGSRSTADTDAEGVYVLDKLPLQKTWLRVTAPKCAPDRRQITPARDGTTVNFRLSPGSRLAGRVMGEEGKPLDQVAVRVYASSFGYVGEMVTGEDGRFAFDSLPDETVILYCRTPEYSDPRTRVKPGQKDMVVTLYRSGHILGKVVDEAGKPVTEFRVFLGLDRTQKGDRRPSYPSRFPYRTGLPVFAADGAFRIEGVTVGAPYRITVSARDYATATESRVMGIPLEKDDVVTIVADKGRTFSGKVVDAASQKPVAGAEVILSVQRPGRHSSSRYKRSHVSSNLPAGSLSCSSRDDGTFRLDNVSPRGYYVIVTHPDYADLSAGYVRFSPSSKNVKSKNQTYVDIPPATERGIKGALLRLSKGATISGICYGEDGKPASGARVVLSGVRYVTTNGDGTYRFDKILPGRYYLSFYEMTPRSSKSARTYRSRYVTAEADEEITVDFRPQEGLTLTGRVVGNKKLRRSLRIRVQELSDARASVSTATDSKGRFSVKGLNPGRYLVSALRYKNRRYQTISKKTVAVSEEKTPAVILRLK
ncbi:MAG: hypothetical protein GXP25_08010 [Planctomycetes bacterium]|nr:hypothetical protein [Planctomycetota bacterium]